jgi:hypothetical protein
MNLVADFPIHDAELISVRTAPGTESTLSLNIDICLHREVADVTSFGLIDRRCRLHFEKCWRIVSDMFGCYSKPELIDRWDVVIKSNLRDQLQEMGCNTEGLKHYRLVFSGGSRIDILAENVSASA